jgi:hypothetical protein
LPSVVCRPAGSVSTIWTFAATPVPVLVTTNSTGIGSHSSASGGTLRTSSSAGSTTFTRAQSEAVWVTDVQKSRGRAEVAMPEN